MEKVEIDDDDYEKNMEPDHGYGDAGVINITGSGRQNLSFELPFKRVEYVSDSKKKRWKHQMCHEHHRPARRRRHSVTPSQILPLQEDNSDLEESFRNWDKTPEGLLDYDDTTGLYESTDEISEDVRDDQLRGAEEQKSAESRSNDGICRCGPSSFSLENLKGKWDGFRGLLGRCYPALPCSDGDYYLLPECPPAERQCDSETDGDYEDPSQNHSNEVDSSGPDQKAGNVSPVHEEPEDRKPSRSGSVEGGFREETETTVCYTPIFWVKLLQIVVLAPLLAFTAYLLMEWMSCRRRYIEKSSQLKKLKRQNETLMSECDRLEAFMMSARMSPLANGKRQEKARQEAARICQSLSECKQKTRELEEERSVLLEVLHNLREPEEDKRNPPSSLNRICSPNHNPMCSCERCVPPT